MVYFSSGAPMCAHKGVRGAREAKCLEARVVNLRGASRRLAEA